MNTRQHISLNPSVPYSSDSILTQLVVYSKRKSLHVSNSHIFHVYYSYYEYSILFMKQIY